MIMAWIKEFHSSAPGTRQGNVLQSFSHAITGVQDVKLPFHINGCDEAFDLVSLRAVTLQLPTIHQFKTYSLQ